MIYMVYLRNYKNNEVFMKSQICWECKNNLKCKSCQMLKDLSLTFGPFTPERTGTDTYQIDITARNFDKAVHDIRRIMKSYRWDYKQK